MVDFNAKISGVPICVSFDGCVKARGAPAGRSGAEATVMRQRGWIKGAREGLGGGYQPVFLWFTSHKCQGSYIKVKFLGFLYIRIKLRVHIWGKL
jgi:hypothetical protein